MRDDYDIAMIRINYPIMDELTGMTVLQVSHCRFQYVQPLPLSLQDNKFNEGTMMPICLPDNKGQELYLRMSKDPNLDDISVRK